MNWKSAYLETRILSASPLDLVNILYEHAILEVSDARQHLADGDVAARSRSVSKAIAIIGELQRSLDHDAGGEIAMNLARLYQYMRERLSDGNVQQSDLPLAEVSRLLESLGDAWRAINPGSSPWLNSSVSRIPLGEAPPAAMGGWSV